MKVKVALIFSLKDPAGRNMAARIFEDAGEQFSLGSKSIELVPFEREVLYVRAESELRVEDFDYLVILSRHSGTPNRPIITAHVPGNFCRARYGGDDYTLGVAIPTLMKEYLLHASSLVEGSPYTVGFEPTHHGPTLDIPTAFLEIGSDERAWNDELGVKIASESVLKALESWEIEKYRAAIAFGGPHVNDHFTKVMLGTDVAIGHAVRKLDAHCVDKVMIEMAIARNGETPEVAVVDNKGLKGEDRSRIESALNELGLEVVRVKRLLREGS